MLLPQPRQNINIASLFFFPACIRSENAYDFSFEFFFYFILSFQDKKPDLINIDVVPLYSIASASSILATYFCVHAYIGVLFQRIKYLV